MCARNTACVHIVHIACVHIVHIVSAHTAHIVSVLTLRTPIGSCSVLLGSVSQVRNVGCAGCAMGGSIEVEVLVVGWRRYWVVGWWRYWWLVHTTVGGRARSRFTLIKLRPVCELRPTSLFSFAAQIRPGVCQQSRPKVSILE